MESSGLFGCAAGLMADAAPAEFRKKTQLPKKRSVQVLAPRPQDELPKGTCRRCGFPGPHPTAEACIATLRDQLSMLQP